MLQEEFKRLTDKPFTEEEFEKIHYVYIFLPRHCDTCGHRSDLGNRRNPPD